MTADTATGVAIREPRRRTRRRRDPRVRLRRTTVSTDQQSWIILRDIAISPHSEVSLALFPAYDANGNVTELVGTNGTRQARYEYDPFGQVASMDGFKVGACPFRFSTKYWDEDAACYYYGYRWYDPWSGRWLSRDPIGEEGGTCLYAYVGNRTTTRIDVLGREPVESDGAQTSPAPRSVDLCSFVTISARVLYSHWWSGSRWESALPPSSKPYRNKGCLRSMLVEVLPKAGFDAKYDPAIGNDEAPWTGNILPSTGYGAEREWRYQPAVSVSDPLFLRPRGATLWMGIPGFGGERPLSRGYTFLLLRGDILRIVVKVYDKTDNEVLGGSRTCMDETFTVTP